MTEKMRLPQFVIDYIEKCKEDRWWLSAALNLKDIQTPEIKDWLGLTVELNMAQRIKHQNDFARAWLNPECVEGYEYKFKVGDFVSKDDSIFKIYRLNDENTQVYVSEYIKNTFELDIHGFWIDIDEVVLASDDDIREYRTARRFYHKNRIPFRFKVGDLINTKNGLRLITEDDIHSGIYTKKYILSTMIQLVFPVEEIAKELDLRGLKINVEGSE